MAGDRALVLNSDAAIRLSRLGYLQSLGQTTAVVIAPSVAGRLLDQQDIADLRWIRVVTPAPEVFGQAFEATRADRSELDTIALAIQLGATAVIDSEASFLAVRASVPVSNSVSVLTAIHGLGMANRSIEEDLDILETTGARLDNWTREMTSETVQSLAVLQAPDGGIAIGDL